MCDDYRCARCQDYLEVNSISAPLPDPTVYLEPCERCLEAGIEGETRREAELLKANIFSLTAQALAEAVRKHDGPINPQPIEDFVQGVQKLARAEGHDIMSQAIENSWGRQQRPDSAKGLLRTTIMGE